MTYQEMLDLVCQVGRLCSQPAAQCRECCESAAGDVLPLQASKCCNPSTQLSAPAVSQISTHLQFEMLGTCSKLACAWDVQQTCLFTLPAHPSVPLPPSAQQIGNYLRSQGVGPDDEVGIYLPMVPELPATMVRMLDLCCGLLWKERELCLFCWQLDKPITPELPATMVSCFSW